jgi:hypothetical protein
MVWLVLPGLVDGLVGSSWSCEWVWLVLPGLVNGSGWFYLVWWMVWLVSGIVCTAPPISEENSSLNETV